MQHLKWGEPVRHSKEIRCTQSVFSMHGMEVPVHESPVLFVGWSLYGVEAAVQRPKSG